MKPFKTFVLIPSILLSVTLPHLSMANDDSSKPTTTAQAELIESDMDCLDKLLGEIQQTANLPATSQERRQQAHQKALSDSVSAIKSLSEGNIASLLEHPAFQFIKNVAANVDDSTKEEMTKLQNLIDKTINGEAASNMYQVKEALGGKINDIKDIEAEYDLIRNTEDRDDSSGGLKKKIVESGDRAQQTIRERGSKATTSIAKAAVYVTNPLLYVVAKAGTALKGKYNEAKITAQNKKGELWVKMKGAQSAIETIKDKYQQAIEVYAVMVEHQIMNIPGTIERIESAKDKLQEIHTKKQTISAYRDKVARTGDQYQVEQLNMAIGFLEGAENNLRAIIENRTATVVSFTREVGQSALMIVLAQRDIENLDEIVADYANRMSVEVPKKTLLDAGDTLAYALNSMIQGQARLINSNNVRMGRALVRQTIEEKTIHMMAQATFESAEMVQAGMDYEKNHSQDRLEKYLSLPGNEKVREYGNRLKSLAQQSSEKLLNSSSSLIGLAIDEKKAIEQQIESDTRKNK